MQAKDISVEDVVESVLALKYRHGNATAQSLTDELAIYPYKVVRAKIKNLDKKGIIVGCGCGCGSPIWVIDQETGAWL